MNKLIKDLWNKVFSNKDSVEKIPLSVIFEEDKTSKSVRKIRAFSKETGRLLAVINFCTFKKTWDIAVKYDLLFNGSIPISMWSEYRSAEHCKMDFLATLVRYNYEVTSEDATIE